MSGISVDIAAAFVKNNPYVILFGAAIAVGSFLFNIYLAYKKYKLNRSLKNKKKELEEKQE